MSTFRFRSLSCKASQALVFLLCLETSINRNQSFVEQTELHFRLKKYHRSEQVVWNGQLVLLYQREKRNRRKVHLEREKESSLYGDPSISSIPRARLTTLTTSIMVTCPSLSKSPALLGGALVGGGQTLGGGAGARHCEYKCQKTDAQV